jgi:hypothetical protein
MPGPCLHRGPAYLPKHDTVPVSSWPGHGFKRAGPCSCWAACRPAGRPVWTTIVPSRAWCMHACEGCDATFLSGTRTACAIGDAGPAHVLHHAVVHVTCPCPARLNKRPTFSAFQRAAPPSPFHPFSLVRLLMNRK